MDAFIISIIVVISFIALIYIPLIIHSIYKSCCKKYKKVEPESNETESNNPIIVTNPYLI